MAPTADLTIVGGAGHVGVPLALTFARSGLTVNIHDQNHKALDQLAAGVSPFIEDGAQVLLASALKEHKLIFTSVPCNISTPGPVIITIGTPVDPWGEPLKDVPLDCVKSIEPELKDGQLLVLRSTVYPGTTQRIHDFLQSKGRNIHVAFCPERILQGHAINELTTIPQIISGTTDKALSEARKLFERIAPEVLFLEPLEAELAKLYHNAHRYIEFAVANQFYLISQAAGVDHGRILRQMKYHYPRAATMASPGFTGGPCLPKDAAQLLDYATYGLKMGCGLLGSAYNINQSQMVWEVFDRLEKTYGADGVKKLKVGLLGAAFKAESDDPRGSLAYGIKHDLEPLVAAVYMTDPYVTTDPELRSFEYVIEESDVLVLCTPHEYYVNQSWSLQTAFDHLPVIDVWGYLLNAEKI